MGATNGSITPGWEVSGTDWHLLYVQEECNKLLGGFPLPSSGHLTSDTLHRLRGDMLDATSKLTR